MQVLEDRVATVRNITLAVKKCIFFSPVQKFIHKTDPCTFFSTPTHETSKEREVGFNLSAHDESLRIVPN